MENNTACKKYSSDHYDNFKVPHFLYCFGSNGCFQVEWQQIIGIFGLSSKVDRCLLFFSRRCGKWWWSSSIAVTHVSLRIWRMTSFKTAQKLQTVDEKNLKSHSWKHRTLKIMNCVLLRRMQKISGMLFLLEKQYWKKTKIKKRPIRISALNYRFTDKEKNQPWRILKNFLWDLFK